MPIWVFPTLLLEMNKPLFGCDFGIGRVWDEDNVRGAACEAAFVGLGWSFSKEVDNLSGLLFGLENRLEKSVHHARYVS